MHGESPGNTESGIYGGKPLKTLLKGEKRRIAIAAALIVVLGVVLYEVLEHFGPVRSAVSTFVKVVAPILYGLCVAFVLNLPMSFFEDRVFKKLKAKKPGLTRAICVVITYVLVLGSSRSYRRSWCRRSSRA